MFYVDLIATMLAKYWRSYNLPCIDFASSSFFLIRSKMIGCLKLQLKRSSTIEKRLEVMEKFCILDSVLIQSKLF